MRWQFAPLVGCAVFLLFETGCTNSGSSGIITGTVSVDGKKLKRGLVTFMPENAKRGIFNAAIIEGKYEISGVPTGLAKIVIIPGMEPPATGDNPDGNDGARPAAATKQEDLATSVPAKYHDAATSGLELTVKPGRNDYDLNLTP
jgi:hypothetical protein